MIALLAFGLALGTVQPPFASVDAAAESLRGGATVLDARSRAAFKHGHLPGAVRIDWEDFRDGWGRTGRLDDDDRRLARKLSALGVDDTRAVLVYGASREGWGEEGRIDWMLEYLGHREVRILDGGYEAWRAEGRPTETGAQHPAREGHFTIRRDASLRAELVDVKRELGDGKTLLLDARTLAEWNGATPYFEARGGHIPGARSLEWKELLTADGRVRPGSEIRQRIASVGAGTGTPIVVYCTGGVRSALAWAALRAAGFRDVRNFDGSFWLWAQHREVPVETQGR